MVKMMNPCKEYPPNLGKYWSEEEEGALLEELGKDTSIEMIAANHARTVGGITSRIRYIVNNLHSKDMSIEEISHIVNKNIGEIQNIIDKNRKNKNDFSKSKKENVKEFSLENEMKEMKKEIKEMKTSINELIEMMKAVYEFEDS